MIMLYVMFLGGEASNDNSVEFLDLGVDLNMSWWTSPNVYPKRKNKFIIEFGGGHRLFNVKTCTLPSVEVATKEYTLINHKFNYPGIPTWQPVKMTFVDVVGINQSNKVFTDTSDFLFNMLK